MELLKNSFYHSSNQVLIDFIKPIIVIHAFFFKKKKKKQLHFLTSASNTYNRMNVQSESCLAVA